MDKPAPCPNCGLSAMVSTELSGGRPYGVCDNPDCGAFGLGLPLATWNSRVYPPKVQAVLMAAIEYYDASIDDDVENFFRAKSNFSNALRALKESEAKDV